MVSVFLIGYIFIALEHKTQINKAAIALVMASSLWTLLVFAIGNPEYGLNAKHINDEMFKSLASAAEIIFYLIGAMTIVDLIDIHEGFRFITDSIKTRNKIKLLWIIAVLTFFMSAALDNMTTAIIMVALMRKLLTDQKERWMFAGVIVIAANSGGAWSPIGDVTTIMLWMKGNVTTANIIPALMLPSIVSLLIPTFFVSRFLKGSLEERGAEETFFVPRTIPTKDSFIILFLGVGLLLFVPVFKTITHLPPYLAMIMSLGTMWIVTEIMHRNRPQTDDSSKYKVSKIIRNIDMPTILFFLGILLAVSSLECVGVLSSFSGWLDNEVHNVYVINTLIGMLSSIVDNVPLVAAAIGMYPVNDIGTIATAADPAYAAFFVQDGIFWHLLAYCAGVGGSLLIIGSAAGVVAMGLEKINFMWYLKNFTLVTFLGYIAGVLVYVGQIYILVLI